MSAMPDNLKAARTRRLVHPLAEHEMPLTWAKTRAYMRSDFDRYLENIGDRGTSFRRLFWRLLPNNQAIFWYRVSRYLYVNDWRTLAMFAFVFNQYLTRSELPPFTSIGPGCLIGHSVGVNLYGRIGSNFTVYGQAGTGGGFGDADVGGGRGYPLVGDNVTMAHFAVAQGPMRVGDRVSFGPHAHVTRDVPAGAVVIGAPSRVQTKSERSTDSGTSA